MQLCMSNVCMYVFMNMYKYEEVCNFNPLSLSALSQPHSVTLVSPSGIPASIESY